MEILSFIAMIIEGTGEAILNISKHIACMCVKLSILEEIETAQVGHAEIYIKKRMK